MIGLNNFLTLFSRICLHDEILSTTKYNDDDIFQMAEMWLQNHIISIGELFVCYNRGTHLSTDYQKQIENWNITNGLHSKTKIKRFLIFSVSPQRNRRWIQSVHIRKRIKILMTWSYLFFVAAIKIELRNHILTVMISLLNNKSLNMWLFF